MKKPSAANDLPAQALLLSGLRRAARIALCPLCAQERQAIITPEGQPGFYCPRCGDFEPLSATEPREAR